MVLIRHRRGVPETAWASLLETPVPVFVRQNLLVGQHSAPQWEANVRHPRAAMAAVQVAQEGRDLQKVTEADQGSTELVADQVGKRPVFHSDQNQLS